MLTINYWEQILENRKKIDYIKWILCDKYVAKQFASNIGFKIPKTIQLIKEPSHINFTILKTKYNNKYVIKPIDLCDSKGVYLMKNNINLITNTQITQSEIKQELQIIRTKIHQEYYMHELMFDYKIPFKGYIVEELILDENNNPPSDYKCYVFNGRVFLIANTYNRTIKFNSKKNIFEQNFNSIWMTRNGNALPFPMIKKNYKYTRKIEKPQGFTKMIALVEKASSILHRHCRIDVYLLNGEVYFGEFTFFGGAFLHTRLANTLLGIKWLLNPDQINIKNNQKLKKILKKIVPSFYNKVD